jgi:hypothetical protein
MAYNLRWGENLIISIAVVMQIVVHAKCKID